MRKIEKEIIDLYYNVLKPNSMKTLLSKDYYKERGISFSSLNNEILTKVKESLMKKSLKDLIRMSNTFNHKKFTFNGSRWDYSSKVLFNMLRDGFVLGKEQPRYSYRSGDEFYYNNYVLDESAYSDIFSKTHIAKYSYRLLKNTYPLIAEVVIFKIIYNYDLQKKILCSKNDLLFYHLASHWTTKDRQIILRSKKVQRSIYNRLVTSKSKPIINACCNSILQDPDLIVKAIKEHGDKLSDTNIMNLGSSLSIWLENNIHNIAKKDIPIDYFRFSRKIKTRGYWDPSISSTRIRITENIANLSDKKRLEVLSKFVTIVLDEESYNSPAINYISYTAQHIIPTIDRKNLFMFMSIIDMKNGNGYASRLSMAIKGYLFNEIS